MAAYSDEEEAPTKLGKLLLKTVPENRFGRKTLSHLAELLGVSRNALQKWITAQRVPSLRVDRLVEIGKVGQAPDEEGEVSSRVSREDFHDFIFGSPGD